MYKVTDYLVQSQQASAGHAELRPLDTRGGGHVLATLWFLPLAICRVFLGRLRGQLAGVHINMAERLSFFRKAGLVLACRAFGVPVIIHLHAAQMHHVYRGMPSWVQAYVRWVFSLANEVLVLGQASRRFVEQELLVPAARVHPIINGVPPATQVRRQRQPGTPFNVLFLGNLSERKGVTDLLRALALLKGREPRWQATIAGGGDVAGYTALAEDLGLAGQVSFFGWADQPAAARLMADADALVLPSYDEGLPLVVLEAMANGVAVVCTPVGEIGHTFSDEREVLLVQPGDEQGIAAALSRLMSDDALRECLEQAGQTAWAQRFSMKAFFNAVAAAHQRVFATHSVFDEQRFGGRP